MQNNPFAREYIENPFRQPQLISPELDNYVKTFISNKFKSSGSLEYFEFINFFQQSLTDKNLELAEIIAYYMYNIINNSDKISKEKKHEMISSIYYVISSEKASTCDDELIVDNM